ncbi:MAG TPA: 3-alpha,7-alpha,12-alpha-trihydroxy-5-beta-cholest-24-enoyl-CoA hydratase [Hyphomonadaceae bacterium]|nr:3-alpha,7-alpha,12-alpha-trihydroxy-5-beta-cholest-24-enoyl-CoA hydratase [Hyphomonadaceae bacterium]
MAIDLAHLLSLKQQDQPFAYGDREVMLYALGIGMGADPLNADELRFVYENGLKVVPSFATVAAWGAGRMAESGINYLMVVHGEQRLRVHRPLPAEAQILADSAIVEAIDKGPSKGAILIHDTVLKDAKTGDKLVTLSSSIFARGDGGFGGPSEGGLTPHVIPARAPDQELEIATRPDQALIYRLSGDRNPLHSDPNFAAAAGFPRPILHGLCTYGICCRAVMQTYAGFDPSLLRSFDARFSAPVFPGEMISVQMWRDGDIVSFEARVAARDAVVIRNGRAELG